MSKTKKALKRNIADLEAGAAPVWARKTEFISEYRFWVCPDSRKPLNLM
ncbi:MAG: hypothetical protein HYR49_00295 [Gammaproteobacteria bacterium]|nr:hypothetical protein [Gammaproteobacteria bacterium]